MHRMVSSSAAAGQTAEMDSAAHTPSRSEVSGNGAARETAVLTFQEAIARLQSYWASVGCAVWQPFNSEVQSLQVTCACRVPLLFAAVRPQHIGFPFLSFFTVQQQVSTPGMRAGVSPLSCLAACR